MRSRPGFLWLASLAGLAALIPADAARAATILSVHSRDQITAHSLTTGLLSNFSVMSTDLAASDALVNLLRPDTGKAFAPDDLQAYFPLAKADELSLPGTPAAQLPVFLDRTLEAGSQARMSLSVAVAIDITERPGNFERVFLWQPGGHGNRISGGTENAFGQPKARPSTPVTASLGLPMLLIFWCCFRRIATAARV